MRTESPFSSSQHRILPYVAFNKDAFPNCRHLPAGPNHSACRNKPSFFRVNLKRNIRLSFALRSRAAQLSKAIALNQDLAFGTFHSGRALALRTLASTRSIYGASNPGPTL